MAANYLEQLVAEWYEYQGYFVRRNVRCGPRDKGGHEGELDVVAFHPVLKHLVHIEPSMDADSWAERERKYTRKFTTGRKHIPRLFDGIELPGSIEQIALLVVTGGAEHKTLGGGKLVLLSEFVAEILAKLNGVDLMRRAVPEQFPLIRTLQVVSQYRRELSARVTKDKL